MKNWWQWALAALGIGVVGTGGYVAYKAMPLPGTKTLGLGSIVQFRSLPFGLGPKLPTGSFQITGKGSKPGTYLSQMGSTTVEFSPSDIGVINIKAPTVPLLAA